MEEVRSTWKRVDDTGNVGLHDAIPPRRSAWTIETTAENDAMRRRPTKTIVAASFGAAMIFAVTVLASQVAVLMHDGATTRLIERIGDVYLDGLSAAVAPHVESGRTGELQKVLERMASYHDGVREVRLVIRSPAGAVLADLSRDDAAARAELPPAREEVSLTSTEDRGRLWVQRPLLIGTRLFAVLSAQLDVNPIRDERFSANLTSLVLNAVLAVLLAGIGFLVMRRLLGPLGRLEAALIDAVDGDPRPIPVSDGHRTASRVDRLLAEYNRMATASAERTQLQLMLAERLRSADLGRLAATIAHEVRNPLTGMLNAVDTARRFATNPTAVAGSLDLLERGLQAIARVVETTLSIHRPSPRNAEMKAVDFDDLERLLAPLADRRQARLRWRADVGEAWAVDGTTVRQIVLNLAINALEAAGAGGIVAVSVERRGDRGILRIADDGLGLKTEFVDRINAIDVAWVDTTERGIGLGVVVRAVASLGGRITARTIDAGGTEIEVSLPLAPRRAGDSGVSS